MKLRRGAAGLAAAAALVVGGAAPAAADPARPTNFRSTILGTQPELPAGVQARIIGGDSFLELSVAGHEVIVPDYATGPDDEAVPYLRFGPDGTVERNLRAAATAANETRYGTAARTPDLDAPPEWERVASDGTYAWHDHRIHWMAPTAPRAVAADGRVDLGGPDGTWEVPLVVDGEAVTVRGELTLAPAPPAWPWYLLAAATAALVVLGARRVGQWVAGTAAVMGAAGAVVAAAATWRAIPPDAGGSAVPLAVCAATLAAATLAALGPARARLAATAATAAGLVGWSVLRTAVWSNAVLPTSVPAVDRAATAVALGVGVALAIGLVWAPQPAPAASAPGPEGLRSSPTA